MEDRPAGEDEPAQDGNRGERRGNRVTAPHGSSGRASEGGEVRGYVVCRGNEFLVDDVGERDETTAREGDGQDYTHHVRSLAEAGLRNTTRSTVARHNCSSVDAQERPWSYRVTRLPR